MANLVPVNTIIPLTNESLYCQPRVALFMPTLNNTVDSSSAIFYYVVLVDLPNDSNFPAPINTPQIQSDGSLLYPYVCADGNPPPDTPPAGVAMVTYILPVWGGNPAPIQSGDDSIYPSVYFAVVDPKHKGTVKRPTTVDGPVLPPQPVYECETIVMQSATNTGQIWTGCLVYVNDWDTVITSTGAPNVSISVLQAAPPAPTCKSFQGFQTGILQPTLLNGINSVVVVFAPNDAPSSQPAALFSYLNSDMTTL